MIKSADDDKNTNDIDTSVFIAEFKKAMNDDFNTPQAIAAVFNYLTEINKISRHFEGKL